jgi:predicted extracellular nuclease
MPFLAQAGGTPAPLVINEIDYDQVGTDAAEFIELKASSSIAHLSDYRIEFVNGSDNSTYSTINLSDVALAAGGYYVICGNTTTTPNCNQVISTIASTNVIQNGAPDGVRLVRISDSAVIDAMSYEGSMACCTEGTALPASPADDSATANFGYSRFADGLDTNNNATDFSLRCITPGAANAAGASDCPTPSSGPSLSINDVSITEGNSGVSLAQFTVSLSSPAGSSGVSFDIATTDATATTADSDYVARTLTAQTIAAGSSTYTFEVTINGDTSTEANETFQVNITNVTGATLGDGQGIGTIVSDDGVLPSLTLIAPAPTFEGTSGCVGAKTIFNFTVDATPTPSTDINFTWNSSDGTAQDGSSVDEDSDYVAVIDQRGTITADTSSTTLAVEVFCDSTIEANETFSITLSPGMGYALQTASATATIINDDVTPISSIQGTSRTSPMVGMNVVTRGVVSGRVSNGFYIQSQSSDVDADDNTSEGLFIFTSSVPSADVVLGNLLMVSGTVTEFVPPSDLGQQPLTQLTSPTITVLSRDAALPTPVALSTTRPSPTAGIEQLESLENMRVTADSFTVVGPTDGNVNETNATATSNGRFYAVVTGTARPFRESGIEIEDSAGLASSIPIWDGNPEKITLESARMRDTVNAPRAAIDVDTGAALQGITGILDYAFRNYRLSVDFGSNPTVSPGNAPAAVSVASASEITIASYNLERFFDDQNDPAIGEPILTNGAFQTRLAKASLGIRNFLRTPDILGVTEVENLSTLQALATRISTDAISAGQADPQYVAYLSEGNDVGGIDVGFLVKTAPLGGSTTPRVQVNNTTQLGASTTFNCGGVDEVLNDRPPLILSARINAVSGRTTPITVIVNHLRSLNGVNGAGVGCGTLTEGERVRLKRLRQAEFLATLIQNAQTANPTEHIVLVGDFNAFEFNDGYVDVMGTITGAPATDASTLVSGDGMDLVTPNFTNLSVAPSTLPTNRYSFVFSGNAQNLDHILVNASAATTLSPVRLEHARINADFGEDNRGDAAIPVRLSDHDALVAYFTDSGASLPDAIFSHSFEGTP